ncbi:unnamed protein product [Polarella glacialis]|uniref:AB hydrolase-1 domain-containing protein n=1 Tax=Polarella glacialis TaxID=89957 RepID=A0A813FMU2_POLGL|nr:unnamed protein product [Polarella glacialis]CAE8692861.1 unnamed protein product [Polarella glacialis]
MEERSTRGTPSSHGLRVTGGTDEYLQQVLRRCPALLRPYMPHALSFSGYASSGVAAVRGAVAPAWLLHSTETPVVLSDGGTVSLDWWPFHGDSARPVVALLLPGLGSSSRSIYIRMAMDRFSKAGLRPVALNYRGVEHLEPTSQRLAAADAWRDLPEVLRAVKDAHPGSVVVAVGYSMGGVILARYLGESGIDCGISAAVTVSAPLDYQEHHRKLLGQKKLSFVLSLPLKAWFLSKRHEFRRHLPNFRLADALRSGSLHGLIEAVLCESNGYASAEEYFRINDPTPLLQRVACPMLVITATDDPIVGPDITPYAAIRGNNRILLAETDKGGHLGWGGLSTRWGPTLSASWADLVAAQFLSAAASFGGESSEAHLSRLSSDGSCLLQSLPMSRL